jgi:iron complex transport system ATP-binding protein
MLKTETIHFNIGKKRILKDISVDFFPGEFTMILGPNGSGKSSFLKIFSGEIKHFSGNVFYGGTNISSLTARDLAKKRGVMSQQSEMSFPMQVEEIVMMGRYPHFEINPSKKDVAICREVIHRMNLDGFKERFYNTLSGGEKQRVQFARVLAQIWEEPVEGYRYLFLDEPLNNLDINYQQEFLKVAAAFARHNTVLIAVMHDINLALQYADRVIFFKEGSVVAHGEPESVVTSCLIDEVFHTKSAMIRNPNSGKPLVIY